MHFIKNLFGFIWTNLGRLRRFLNGLLLFLFFSIMRMSSVFVLSILRLIDHFGDLKRIHLIGIGGSGMVGLARILLKKGFLISGSDLVMTDELNTLKKIGARIQLGHHPRYIKHTDLVVASSAISRSNDELVFARRNKKITRV